MALKHWGETMSVKSDGARALLAATSLLALTYATNAFGQSASASAAAPAADQGNAVGEVIVTAEKRSTTLLQVPVAVSAFTSAKRDQIGIDSVQDMTNFTPGFVYNTGNDRVSIRGIGRYTNQLGADSSVGVYEDGSFETFTVKAGNDSIFVDRIEVLRGPQGTLYGRASIGGAINIISRTPTDTFYGEVRSMYDNYNQHIEEGAFSGPLTDNIQVRIAASKTDQPDGYFKNLNGGPSQGNVRDEWYLEGQIQGKFGPKFDFWSKFFGGEWSNLGGNAGGKITNQVLVGADGRTALATPTYALNTAGNLATGIPAETTDPLVPSLGAFQQPGVTNVVTTNPSGLNPGNQNIRNIYSTIPQYVRLRAYYGTTIKLNFHLDGMDIKYVGSGQHYSYVTHEEWGEGDQLASGVVSYTNPGGITIFPDSILRYEETHWFTTNEINVLSTGDAPLQWVVGAYNFNEQYKQPEEISLPGQAQLATPLTLAGAAAALNRNRDVVFQEARMGAETFAVFAQTDWKFMEHWKTTLGIRYSYDEKFGLDRARLLAFGPQIGIGVPFAFDLTPVALPEGGNPAVNGGLPPAERGASAATLDPATGIATRKLGANWGGITATAGLQWEPDRDTNVYAKYSRGYKSGGFNSGFGLAANPETNPETSNDYQFGVKKQFGRTVTVNLDLFYDQYYNAQIPISVAGGAGTLSAEFYNVPEARSDGVEIETTWQPIKPLQFILNYGYNGTDILKSGCVVDALADPLAVKVGATPGGCPGIFNAAGVKTSQPQNLDGDRLPEAPEHKIAFNTNYTFLFDPGSLSLSLSYVWRDVQYGSLFTRPYNAAPSWDQVDLRAEFRSANGHYSIIAYGKNVFDSTGYISGALGVGQTNGTFIKQYTLTPPALYGVELQYRF
jgi:iron complex outermembrane receptor protein